MVLGGSLVFRRCTDPRLVKVSVKFCEIFPPALRTAQQIIKYTALEQNSADISIFLFKKIIILSLYSLMVNKSTVLALTRYFF